MDILAPRARRLFGCCLNRRKPQPILDQAALQRVLAAGDSPEVHRKAYAMLKAAANAGVAEATALIDERSWWWLETEDLPFLQKASANYETAKKAQILLLAQRDQFTAIPPLLRDIDNAFLKRAHAAPRYPVGDVQAGNTLLTSSINLPEMSYTTPEGRTKFELLARAKLTEMARRGSVAAENIESYIRLTRLSQGVCAAMCGHLEQRACELFSLPAEEFEAALIKEAQLFAGGAPLEIAANQLAFVSSDSSKSWLAGLDEIRSVLTPSQMPHFWVLILLSQQLLKNGEATVEDWLRVKGLSNDRLWEAMKSLEGEDLAKRTRAFAEILTTSAPDSELEAAGDSWIEAMSAAASANEYLRHIDFRAALPLCETIIPFLAANDKDELQIPTEPSLTPDTMDLADRAIDISDIRAERAAWEQALYSTEQTPESNPLHTVLTYHGFGRMADSVGPRKERAVLGGQYKCIKIHTSLTGDAERMASWMNLDYGVYNLDLLMNKTSGHSASLINHIAGIYLFETNEGLWRCSARNPLSSLMGLLNSYSSVLSHNHALSLHGIVPKACFTTLDTKDSKEREPNETG